MVFTRSVRRFPAPGRGGKRDNEFRGNVMEWIEQQATEAWAPGEDGARAEAAIDFLTVHIEPTPAPAPPYLETRDARSRTQWTQADQPSSSTSAGWNSGQTSGHGRGHGGYADGPPTPSNEEVPRKRQRSERQAEKQREDVIG